MQAWTKVRFFLNKFLSFINWILTVNKVVHKKALLWDINYLIFYYSTLKHALLYHQHHHIQFWSRFIPVNGGGQIYPTLTAISPSPTLHLTRFKASSFSKPTLLLSSCIFLIFFDHSCFLLPFTSNSNTFLKTCPSSLLNTCRYHLTPFAFAICTFFKTDLFSPYCAIICEFFADYAIRCSKKSIVWNHTSAQYGPLLKFFLCTCTSI